MKKILIILICVLQLPLTVVFATSNNDFQSHWAFESIDYVTQNEILPLDENGDFSPNKTTTYTDVAYAVSEIFDVTFDETKKFFETEVLLANQTLNSNVNREFTALLMSEILKHKNENTSIIPGIKYEVLDINSINSLYQQSVLIVWSKGVMRGDDGYFKPSNTIDKATFSICLHRTMDTDVRVSFEKNDIDVPIIMYHSVNDDVEKYNDYIVSSKVFEEDLQYIRDSGYTTIVVADLIDYVYNGVKLPEKPIMITFDDGYEDNYYNAFRLLKEYDMKAVVCPITKFYDDPTIYSELGHLTTLQTIEMEKSGLIEFQSHSYDLHNTEPRYGTLPMTGELMVNYMIALNHDFDLTSNFYKQNNLKMPTTYSYPFGAKRNSTDTFIRDYGFVASFTTTPAKLNTIKQGDFDCLFNLNRLNRSIFVTQESYFNTLENLSR